MDSEGEPRRQCYFAPYMIISYDKSNNTNISIYPVHQDLPLREQVSTINQPSPTSKLCTFDMQDASACEKVYLDAKSRQKHFKNVIHRIQ